MTAPNVLAPLRVPEVGPSLGRLITGTGVEVRGMQLDAIRFGLATRIIKAAGEARRCAAASDRTGAVSALGRERWLEAWEDAVGQATQQFVDRMGAHLVAEGKAAGMPKRKRREVNFDDQERRGLAARLGSAGSHLIPTLDLLEQQGARAVAASPQDRAALEDWQRTVTLAARRLEAAWIALESSLAVEIDVWLRNANDIARWRRPIWPIVVTGLVATAIAAWIGAMAGGFLPVPPWADRLWRVTVVWFDVWFGGARGGG
jgi:hypothetical protein